MAAIVGRTSSKKKEVPQTRTTCSRSMPSPTGLASVSLSKIETRLLGLAENILPVGKTKTTGFLFSTGRLSQISNWFLFTRFLTTCNSGCQIQTPGPEVETCVLRATRWLRCPNLIDSSFGRSSCVRCLLAFHAHTLCLPGSPVSRNCCHSCPRYRSCSGSLPADLCEPEPAAESGPACWVLRSAWGAEYLIHRA